MPRPRSATFVLILWISSAGAFAAPALADPLRFGNVSIAESTGLVGLFENPGRVFTLDENRFNLLTFFIDIVGTLEPSQTDILRLTFRAPDGETLVQESGVPAAGTIPPPFTLVTGPPPFPTSYTPLPFELTVDLLSTAPDFIIPSGPMAGVAVDSYTYSFSTVSPVPEPGTWLLLASGLTMLLRRRRVH
jgi:hypothetical protein